MVVWPIVRDVRDGAKWCRSFKVAKESVPRCSWRREEVDEEKRAEGKVTDAAAVRSSSSVSSANVGALGWRRSDW